MLQNQDINPDIVDWVASVVGPWKYHDQYLPKSGCVNLEQNLRFGISPVRDGMGTPAESNRFAAVQDLEDGEVLRDDVSAGSLSSLLLVN